MNELVKLCSIVSMTETMPHDKIDIISYQFYQVVVIML